MSQQAYPSQLKLSRFFSTVIDDALSTVSSPCNREAWQEQGNSGDIKNAETD